MSEQEKVMAGLECLTHVNSAVYKTECQERQCPCRNTDCEIAVMEDALNLLKAQELCEDAVSREAALEAVEDLKLNDASDELIWLSHVRKQLKALPSAQSSPVARVIALEEVKANRLEPLWLDTQEGSYLGWALWCAYDNEDRMRFYWGDDIEGWRVQVPPDDYGKTWRCWTSRPTDAQREEAKWE